MQRKVLKIKPFIDVILEGLRKGMVINMKNIITALCNSELNDKLKMINEFNILTNDIQYQDGIFEILENKKYQDHLEEMVASQVETITRMQNEVITGVANLIESRDGSTGLHIRNTQNYVRALAKELRKRGMYPDILTAEYEANTINASILHDIGKIKIPDAILQKPGRLNDEEYAVMKTHAALGGEIIDDIIANVEDEKYMEIARQIARHHHERWDGNGYPDHLAGEDIPLCARIMAIADVFDALYQERCYKPPIRPISKVFKILEENSGSQFDPNLMKVFLEIKDEIEEISN